MITIFEGTTDPELLLEQVLLDGVVGIHGMRVAVREVLLKLRAVAWKRGHRSIAALTFDHPDTELGYAFDGDRYRLTAARDAVLAAYELQVGQFRSWELPRKL